MNKIFTFILFACFSIHGRGQVAEYHYLPSSSLEYSLTLKSDCNFQFEEHLKSDHTDYGHGHGVIYWRNGRYYVHGDTLLLSFEPLPPSKSDTLIDTLTGAKTILIPLSFPVFPWTKPSMPDSLIIRKNKMYYFSGSKLRKKQFFLRKDTSEFDLKKSTCKPNPLNGRYKSSESSYRKNFYLTIAHDYITLFGWELRETEKDTVYYMATAKLVVNENKRVKFKFDRYEFFAHPVTFHQPDGFSGGKKIDPSMFHMYFDGEVSGDKLILKAVKESYDSRVDHFEFIKDM